MPALEARFLVTKGYLSGTNHRSQITTFGVDSPRSGDDPMMQYAATSMENARRKMQGRPQPASAKCLVPRYIEQTRENRLNALRPPLSLLFSIHSKVECTVARRAAFERISELKNSTACGGGDFRLSRFVPELNVWRKLLHHLLELREIERLRTIADGFLWRGMHFHD